VAPVRLYHIQDRAKNFRHPLHRITLFVVRGWRQIHIWVTPIIHQTLLVASFCRAAIALQRQSLVHRTRSDILLEVEKAYSIIIPLDEGGVDKYTQLYRRCLLAARDQISKLQEQINETKLSIYLSQESNNEAVPLHSSKFDSINVAITEMSENLGLVESRLEEIQAKVEKLDKDVTELKNSVDERAGSVSTEIGNVEYRLSAQINNIEKTFDARMCDIETTLQNIDQAYRQGMRDMTENIYTVQREVKEDIYTVRTSQLISEAKQQNSTLTRLHQPVNPVGVRYRDVYRRLTFKTTTWKRRKVSYFWKLHNPKYCKELSNLI
jgi:hypothetical protein